MAVLQEEAEQSVPGFAGAEAGVQRQGAAAQTPRQVELVLGMWGLSPRQREQQKQRRRTQKPAVG